jgi:RNA polymerase sigma factor for flagellar operon FliA
MDVEGAEAAALEAALWERFAGGDAEARGQLIERYLPLCRMIAASLYAKRVADDAEFADYMQYATLGLIEAVENFDRGRGVQFNTFATYRIQGAIRNNIANFSERREQVGLLVRLKKERLESIKLDAGSVRPRRGKGSQLVRDMAEVAVIWALSYLLEGSGMLAPRTEAHYVEQFYDSLELKQLRERMVGLVDALPDQERRVVKYHYFQKLEFTEIAKIFGVTKGRISQIHKRALLLLREAHAIAGGLDVKF